MHLVAMQYSYCIATYRSEDRCRQGAASKKTLLEGTLTLACFGESLLQTRVIRGSLLTDRAHHRDKLKLEFAE
jgi:hypothetical protein